ncbi:MAG: hypothetical protein AAGM22_18040 [Acidobacteriota bacterium]
MNRRWRDRARVRVRRWTALCLAASIGLGTPLYADPPAPRVVRQAGVLRLEMPPPVLGDEEIKAQLSSGLTTTFVFRLTGRSGAGADLRGAARVEIRYEPWDEVYFLHALGRDGGEVHKTLESDAALTAAWRALDLVATAPGADPGAGRWRVELDVIPFSRGEQRDTQRWFSESMDSDGGAEQTARASEDRSQALEEVFNLLLATSIGRRAILSYSWQVEVMSR